jgi:hypothetical protein
VTPLEAHNSRGRLTKHTQSGNPDFVSCLETK